MLCSFGVLARGTFLFSRTFKLQIDLPPYWFLGLFSWPQASLDNNFADGKGVVKSHTYQDALWAWARATFVRAHSICQNLSLLIKPLRPDQSNLCTKEMVFQQKLSKKDNFKLTGRAMVRPRPVLTNGKRPNIQCFWRKQIDLVVLLYRVKWSSFTAQAYSHRVCTLELFVVFNIKLKKYNFNIKNKEIFRREVTEEYTEKNLDMTKHEWVIFKSKTSDISKLLYVISRAVRRVKCETILKYH